MTSCHGSSHCITCADEGIAMRVIRLLPEGDLATCEDPAGRRSDVLTALVGPVHLGQRLLVHAGTALLALGEPEGHAP